MSEPCSLLLWWRGRWSGPVLEVLGRRASHICSCASWGLQCLLEAGHGGQHAGHRVLTTREVEAQRVPRPTLSGCRGRAIMGGSVDANLEVIETLK